MVQEIIELEGWLHNIYTDSQTFAIFATHIPEKYRIKPQLFYAAAVKIASGDYESAQALHMIRQFKA